MDTAALDDGDDGLVDLAPPPSVQLQLAAQHDRYRQLLRTFLTWKRHAQTQHERRKCKQRVAAACRVGSIFCQRVFWTRWRVFVVKRRQLRRKETGYVHAYDEKTSPQEVKLDKGEYIGLHKEKSTTTASSSDENAGQKQRWRLALDKDKANPVICSKLNDVERVRSLYAIRRWQGFVRMKQERDTLQQRAYFFLYFWLIKRSLNQLGRYALVKKRDRMLTVKIVQAKRQRLLMKAMQQWRLRLLLRQSLTLWRGYVRQRRHQALLYRPKADTLQRKTHRLLLQFMFGIWAKKHAQNQAQHALVRILDRHLYRKVCERAWKTWKTKVHQITQVESFQRRYQERTLRRIWNAWSIRTREKELREQQRRRAVRHCYLSLLRKGFNGFRTWHTERQLALDRVDTMQDAADFRMMALAFSRWDHFTSERKMQAHKSECAKRHYESRLLKHVWSKGFQCFYSRALATKKMMKDARDFNYSRTVRRSFNTWRELWQDEHNRGQVLDMKVRGFLIEKERAIKTKILENWSEFTGAKAARRIVNAQVRGQAQQRTLQRYFSQWIMHVSVLRWKQITQTRAEQHYKSVIWRKCFERWRQNVALRQRYRKQTRMALVHWKVTLQRKAFNGWKQYLHHKRTKQHRIHEAFEFRHEQFVREGLRHWMTAGLYLQEQRERQVARTQASNTTHVWRRVAAIARHWHYLAIRRRALKEKAQTLGISRDIPQEDMYWQSELLQLQRRKSLAPQWNDNIFKQANVHSENAGSSNWTKERSPLSEFVLLPRNRPQPRRPVEVLLSLEAENLPQPNENMNMHETFRCGFNFPVEPFVPLSPPLINKVKSTSSPPVRAQEPKTPRKSSPSAPVMSPRHRGDGLGLPSTTARQLDVLERKILALSQRKREWKTSQQELEVLREEAESNPSLISKVRAMEEQHALRTKRWLHTKERIRSLASEIQHLRRFCAEIT